MISIDIDHRKPPPAVREQPAVPQFSPRLDVLEPSYRDSWAIGPLAQKLSRFAARHLPVKAMLMRNAMPLVSFTFDDVPASSCEIGAPLLERFGVRGTFYVSGGGCGATGPCGPLATLDQIRKLWRSGHEIGCHTYSHPAVSRLSPDELRADLARNARLLGDVSSEIAVRNFAYPYGDVSWQSKRHLAAQYDSCRTIAPGMNSNIIDLGVLKSFMLDDESINRATIERLMTDTARLGGWLILCSHDVDMHPSPYGVSPKLLEFAVGAAQAAGCTCVTVAEALKLVRGD